VETDAEFERFSRKHKLTIIASSAICTEDAHVANKTAFMFCAEKVHLEMILSSKYEIIHNSHVITFTKLSIHFNMSPFRELTPCQTHALTMTKAPLER